MISTIDKSSGQTSGSTTTKLRLVRNICIAGFLFLLAVFHVSLPGKLTSDAFKSLRDSAKTETMTKHNHSDDDQQSRSSEVSDKPRIAILMSYVASDMWKVGKRPSFDHMINKACYSHLWNYDFIFNQTRSLSYLSNKTDRGGRSWWLKYGCWERVAHLQAALPRYDWILYGDIDFIIKDFSRPVEDFIREFDTHGKKNVSILLPGQGRSSPGVFASFAVLFRNSPFATAVLENWRQFGLGMCTNGNFPVEKYGSKYKWVYSDQPGLWYALMKTHMEFYPNDVLPESIVTCNKTTGFISEHLPNIGFKHYFGGNQLKTGNYGDELKRVPDNQPIIWSKAHPDSNMASLGVDINWGKKKVKKVHDNTFAVHLNKAAEEWDPAMRRELDVCKSTHGCSAVEQVDNLTNAYQIKVECVGKKK